MENIYYNSIKNHKLEKLDVGDWDVYRMYDPKYGKGTMAVTIIFSPNGIVINGDFAPGNRGVNSVGGYGVEWFGTKKSSHYLAEKFIGKEVYEEERAIKDWELHKKDMIRDGDRQRVEEIESDSDFKYLEWDFEYPVYRFFEQYLPDFWDYSFGRGYPTNTFNQLVGIQQRFMELYQESLI